LIIVGDEFLDESFDDATPARLSSSPGHSQERWPQSATDTARGEVFPGRLSKSKTVASAAAASSAGACIHSSVHNLSPDDFDPFHLILHTSDNQVITIVTRSSFLFFVFGLI
jgi:hypothetical protein